jgi:branched-chain amino acid transport system permease protein
VTIGGAVLLRQLALHVFGPQERALEPFTHGASLKVFGAAIERQTVWIWVFTALSVAVLAVLYRKTAFGRAMRATAIRRDAARLVGVNTALMVTASFALAAGLGAMAGLLFTVGAGMGVKGFAAAVLGGLGDPVGAVCGGLLLGLLEALVAGYIDPVYQDAVAFIVLLLVLFLRPQGILGGSARVKL